MFNGYSFSTDQTIYGSFSSVLAKLDRVNIFDCVRGAKSWPPVDYDSYKFLRELVNTHGYTTLLGHPLIAPLLIFMFNLCKQVSSGIGMNVSSRILMALLGAGGVVMFYRMLKIAGKGEKISLFGASILGLAYVYRNYTIADTGMLSLFGELLVLMTYFGLLKKENRTFWDYAYFGAIFSVAMLLHMAQVMLLPGILISYLFIEKNFVKVVEFLVIPFVVVALLYSCLCMSILKYIFKFYGDNLNGFHCGNLVDYFGFVLTYAGAGTGKDPLIFCMTYFVGVFARLLILLPEKLFFPAGLLILYFLVLEVTQKVINKKMDRYFLAISSVFIFHVAILTVQRMTLLKGYVVLLPSMVYLMSEAVSRNGGGYLATHMRKSAVKTAIAALYVMMIGGFLYDVRFPYKKDWHFNYQPVPVLNKELFDAISEKLPANSILLHDYTYVGPYFGDALCSQGNVLSQTSNYMEFGRKNNYFFLEQFLWHNCPKVFFMLVSNGDSDAILVPADGRLQRYLEFRKANKINDNWFIYKYAGKDMRRGEVFGMFRIDDRPMAAARRYTGKDVFWKTMTVGNDRITAQLPADAAESAVDYRKQKSLVYW